MLALSRLHDDLCLISEEITLAHVFHLKSSTAVGQRNEMLLFEMQMHFLSFKTCQHCKFNR